MTEKEIPEMDESGESGTVFHTLRKLALASIGAVVMAQDELEVFINKMVDRGEIAEKDARKLIDELMNRKKEGTKKAEVEFDKRLDEALHRLNIPTRDDIELLTSKITSLAKKVDELKKGV
jgi:poly(hydroxyalkanoate) granule-associated protein